MTNPFPFTALNILNASDLNAIGETETDWTPTFSTGVTVGNGTASGFYQRVNDFVIVQGNFVLGSTSAITGDVRVDVPVNALNTYELAVGTKVMLDDDSFNREYQGVGYAFSSSKVRLRVLKNDTGNDCVFASAVSSSVPFTWTTNDRLQWTSIYRVGS
jgi:hypothetical protein